MCVDALGRMLEDGNDIAQWLNLDQLDSEGGKGQPPDIFVIGFQEVTSSAKLDGMIEGCVEVEPTSILPLPPLPPLQLTLSETLPDVVLHGRWLSSALKMW